MRLCNFGALQFSINLAAHPSGQTTHAIIAYLPSAQTAQFARALLLAALLLAPHVGCMRRGGSVAPGENFNAGAVFASKTPTLTHHFRVENTTNHPVRIIDERHSCECTSVAVEKRALSVGASTTLIMTVKVPAGYANREVSCTLTTDSSDNPDWNYRLRFESFPEARVVPERIDLGMLSVADTFGNSGLANCQPQEAWLEVFERPERREASVPRVIEVPADFQVSMDETPEVKTLTNGVRQLRHRLTVALRRNASRSGTFIRPVNISIGNAVGATALLVWTVRDVVNCAPSQLSFGMVTPGELPVKRRITLRSGDHRPFRILSFDQSEYLSAEPLPGNGFPSTCASTHALDLVFHYGKQQSQAFLSGSFRIRIDCEECPDVLIPWAAFSRSLEKEITAGREPPNPPSVQTLSERRAR